MDEVGSPIWPAALTGTLMSSVTHIEEFAAEFNTTPDVIRVFLQEFCERGWMTPLIVLECVSCQESAMTSLSPDLPEEVTCRVCGAVQHTEDMLAKIHYVPDKAKMKAELDQLSVDPTEDEVG